MSSVQLSRGARVRNVLWGVPPATKKERNLLFKIDWLILPFACLMYFSNYLDRANLANAYVSGLKEALNMQGHDLNTVNTCFTVGYTIGMLPQNLLLQVVPARILFPLNCLIWGMLTMCTAAAKSTAHLCAIRLFQGIAESSTFVGVHFIMGSWYRDGELGKRGAIFSVAAQIATIFSGVMQASIYTNLDGHSGLQGFQWLFIICGAITIPIAIYGYLLFPGTPERTTGLFLSPEERQLAIDRLPHKPETHLDLSVFKRVLGRWRWWMMSVIWIVGGELESIGSNSLQALWMKSRNASGLASYSVPQINYWPQGATAVAIMALLVTAVWTDYTQKRYQVNLFISVCLLVSGSILLAYPSESVGALMFAFYLAGVSFAGQASNFGWANDICRKDEQERGIVLASMNMFSNAFNSWWSIVFFPANDAPRWRRGMISIIVLCPIMVVLTCTARWLQLRDERKDAQEVQEGREEMGSAKESVGEAKVKEAEGEQA
ncbi:MFS general substrate transporter [Leucosporidium creatinivorum]|uniref:MFS general substrate transporter n=1 Tax=Leucosporidium creatinivorum TaxID=106004 RepID=A0A1Y2G0Q9_9BASI|nr:MFS general substrate transporter [Leucosporidium creatinivorum]